MRRHVLAILIILVVVATAVLYTRERQAAIRRGKIITSITFQEIDEVVRANPNDSEVNKYSRELEGTRVRWSGTVTDIENDRTVYVTTNVYSADVQFDVSREAASGLRAGQKVRFVGTLERVSDAETFPPMFHTHVVLEDVELESSAR